MLQLKQFKLGIIVLCSFLLGNCKKKIIQKPIFSIDQQEAKFIDIPIPLYDERLFMEESDSTKQDETIFGYRSPLSSSMIIDFYVHEMERLGWKQLILFHGAESLIQFESPTRFCSISIRLSKAQSKYPTTDVVIFIGK
ncbi:MAG: hypothetical protein WCD44_00560, partial [Candidatus Babeliales bacterium]